MAETLFNKEFLEKLEYLYLLSKKILSGKNRQNRRSRKIGSGLEFADYREYSPGDDPRHIDWNLYARLQKLFLRLYEEEEDLYVYVLLDISDSMAFGSPNRLDYGRKIAAALSYIALNNLDRVSLVTFADDLKNRLPPNRGKKNIFKILQFLDNLPEAKETDTQQSLQNFVFQTPRRGIAVVISDFFDEKGYQKALNSLRYYKFDVFAIQLYDERELSADLRGDIELVDQETGEVMKTTLSPRVMAAYREAFEEYCQQLEQFCLKSEITLFRTPIQTPFEDLMLEVFRRGGFLG